MTESPVLIVFGSTEGHTAKLARFAADRLRGRGLPVTLCSTAEADRGFEPRDFDTTFIAASLHWTRYQNAVTDFAQMHAGDLNRSRSAFISASLSAAQVSQPGGVTLEDCDRRFQDETGWTPKAIHHAAGGIRHSAYDYFKALTAHMLAEARGERSEGADYYELTDYPALAAFVEQFAAA